MEQNVHPRFPVGKGELTFGLSALIFGILAMNSLLYAGLNLGFALWAMALALTGLRYLHSRGCRFRGYALGLFLLSLAVLGSFARSDDGTGKAFGLLAAVFALNLSFCLAAGQNRRQLGGLGSVLDGFRSFFILGFGSLAPAVRGLNHRRRAGGALGRKGIAALVGVLIALPVLAVMGFLLMRADAAFEALVDLLPERDLSEPVRSLVYGLILALFLFAQGLGLAMTTRMPAVQGQKKGISAITVNILLFSVCGLYGVYLLSQLAYFGGGFSGVLPEGYTLAQYARRGFFEMAALGAMDLALICFGAGLVEKGRKLPKVTALLCLFLAAVTLVLIAAASAKMLLYIRGYGLTRLRVLTEVFMIWLGTTTVLVSLWILKPGFPYMKGVLVTALVLLALTLWVDVDTQVARYNVRAYQAGALETVDAGYLYGLSDGAVPWLRELCGDPDPELAREARELLEYRQEEAPGFRDWNWASGRAASGWE